jgi:hypothetical protein
MAVKIKAETVKGGAVELNKEHGVTASYAVAAVGASEPDELFFANVKLPSGKTVSFFVNRDTGLVVVDIIAKRGNGGNEVLRMNADKVSMPSAKAA